MSQTGDANSPALGTPIKKVKKLFALSKRPWLLPVYICWSVVCLTAWIYGNYNLRKRLSRCPPAFRVEAGLPASLGLSTCEVFYINLDHRVDRRMNIEKQLASIGVSNARRIAATKATPGSLGCTKSHLLAYKSYSNVDGKLLMICEDDISFVSSRADIDLVVQEFNLDDRLDVLLLSYVAFNRVKVSDLLSVSSNAQTTACYIVKKRAVPHLIASAELSIDLLSAGLADKKAAIDVVWKSLQHKLWFAVSSRVHAIQIESYSDIQHKITRYFF